MMVVTKNAMKIINNQNISRPARVLLVHNSIECYIMSDFVMIAHNPTPKE